MCARNCCTRSAAADVDCDCDETATATVAYFRPHLPSACFSLLLSYSAVFAVFMSPVLHAPSATWRHLGNSRSLSPSPPPLAALATKSIVKKMSSVFNLIKWESLLAGLVMKKTPEWFIARAQWELTANIKSPFSFEGLPCSSSVLRFPFSPKLL